MNIRATSQSRSYRARRATRPIYYVVATLLAVAATMAIGAVVFVLWGVYNVSALQQHTEPVYLALDTALKRSISQRAEEIEPPPLSDPAMIRRGFEQFRRNCVQCHGAPGVARDVGKGMTPQPANLVNTARNRTAAEIFWPTKHGIKMSGMPAWQFAFSDEEIWDIVAFVTQLPSMSPADYKAMDERATATSGRETERGEETRMPDPSRGRLALHSYACITCHSIPGVVGPEADVGPPLGGIAERTYIAGVLPNTFENMMLWIRDPIAVDPLTAMPDMEVTEQDAADIATYLQTLD